jgi:tRNA(fMet)-specific endonuclease VapC
MRRYLLDTNSASHHINRRRGVHLRVQEAVQRGDRVGLAMPVVAELFGGVELSATREKNRLRLVHGLTKLPIWPFDRAAAEEYGRVFAALRRMGRPIQPIDIQIAAIARTLGNCTVVTTDSDLQAVPGLAVEDWTDTT